MSSRGAWRGAWGRDLKQVHTQCPEGRPVSGMHERWCMALRRIGGGSWTLNDTGRQPCNRGCVLNPVTPCGPSHLGRDALPQESIKVILHRLLCLATAHHRYGNIKVV